MKPRRMKELLKELTEVLSSIWVRKRLNLSKSKTIHFFKDKNFQA